MLARLLPQSARGSLDVAVGYLLKYGVWGLSDQALLSAANFFTLIFIARAVSPRDFGSYALALTFVLFTMSLQTALLNRPFAVISASREGAAYRRYVTSVLLSQSAYALTANILILASALVAYVAGFEGTAALMAATAFAIGGWGLQEFLRQVMYVEGRLRAAMLNDSLSYGGQVLAVITAALLGVLSPALALALVGVTSFVAVGFGLLQIRGSLDRHLDWQVVRADASEIWRFGRWMIGAALLLGAIDMAYFWLVAGFVSVAGAGALRAVMAVLGPTHLLLKTMDTTLTPVAARAAEREGVSGVKRLVWMMFLLTGPIMAGICLLVSVMAQDVLAFLYGEQYQPYAWLVPFMALSYFLAYSHRPVSIALISRRQPQAIFRGQLFQAAFFATFGIAATFLFGLHGAAITLVGASAVQSLELWRSYLLDIRAPRSMLVAEGSA